MVTCGHGADTGGISMPRRLTDELVGKLPAPAAGNKIYYDERDPKRRGNDYVAGFGLRVTANNVRNFVLNYRTTLGRQRRYTIGSPPSWSVTAARQEAAKLKYEVDQGRDPQAQKKSDRDALTVSA